MSPPCGCGALELEILRGVLATPLWVWSAGARDPEGDPRHTTCGSGALALEILAGVLAAPLWVWSAGARDPEGDRRHAPVGVSAGAGEAEGETFQAHRLHRPPPSDHTIGGGGALNPEPGIIYVKGFVLEAYLINPSGRPSNCLLDIT